MRKKASKEEKNIMTYIGARGRLFEKVGGGGTRGLVWEMV